MFMISAAMGSLFAMVVNTVIPGAHLSPEAFAVAAMGASAGRGLARDFYFHVLRVRNDARLSRACFR